MNEIKYCQYCGTTLREDGTGCHHSASCPVTTISALTAEVERLNQLLYGARCVYCGEVIGQEHQNQDIGDDALKAHIMQCPEHPATKLRSRVEELEQSGGLRWPNHYAAKEEGIVEGKRAAYERCIELLSSIHVDEYGNGQIAEGISIIRTEMAKGGGGWKLIGR